MNAAARLVTQNVLSRSQILALATLSRTQIMLLTLMVGILLSSLSMIYVTQESRSLNASIQHSLSQRDKLQVQWGQLLLERSALMMQARIQHIAEQQLGMVIPNNKSVVIVHE